MEISAVRRRFSPWASVVVLVGKMDDELRFWIDLHKVNNGTIKDRCTLSRIEETLDCLHRAVWFSTLDIKSRKKFAS